ncbi:MAG: Fe-S protein assembly co-chaperone HscB [Gallionellaceae bacterium]|jgi:molecular chaperone HscB
MQHLDFKDNFFILLSLPVGFQVDLQQLEQNFRALQAQVHPDKFSHLPEAERRVSMQWSTRVNEAYQTLRKPIDRARYLLSLQGVDTQEETNTAMPMDFLMQQMEWRESIEAAKTSAQLEALLAELNQEMNRLQQQLALAIDDQHDYLAAAGIVRKLKFFEKLAEEIDASFDLIDY